MERVGKMIKGIKGEMWWWFVLAGASAVAAQEPAVEPTVTPGAAEDVAHAIRFDRPEPVPRNSFNFGYRMGINVAVDFKGIGGFAPMTDPGPATGSGFNRNYDDGFNRVDSSGSAGGMTWYWGYSDAAQAGGGQNLIMNSSSSTSRAKKVDVDEDMTHGPEFTYRRDLGPFWKGRWGMEGSFSYTWLDVENHSTFNNSVTTIADSFALNGVVPPVAPYQGTFNGPGPVISDNPQRATIASTTGALVVGERQMEADLYQFRFGPYWEVPLSDRVAVSLSSGLAFAVVDSEFSYSESVTITGAGTVTHAGSESQTDMAFGGYVAGTLTYALSERWDLYGSIQYVNLGHYDQSEADKQAVIDFDDSIFFSLGAGYRF